MAQADRLKLYLIHCGYYDKALAEGAYEAHVDFFVAAGSFEEARARARELPEFKRLAMHVDGMQEILAVQGHPVALGPEDPTLDGRSRILVHRRRGHPPKERS